MIPGQYEIEFSVDEFDQLLEIQQELLNNMSEEEEEQTNGKMNHDFTTRVNNLFGFLGEQCEKLW